MIATKYDFNQIEIEKAWSFEEKTQRDKLVGLNNCYF